MLFPMGIPDNKREGNITFFAVGMLQDDNWEDEPSETNIQEQEASTQPPELQAALWDYLLEMILPSQVKIEALKERCHYVIVDCKLGAILM